MGRNEFSSRDSAVLKSRFTQHLPRIVLRTSTDPLNVPLLPMQTNPGPNIAKYYHVTSGTMMAMLGIMPHYWPRAVLGVSMDYLRRWGPREYNYKIKHLRKQYKGWTIMNSEETFEKHILYHHPEDNQIYNYI